MVPGSVMCAPTLKDITRAHAIMNQFRKDWLETLWLGCSLERYLRSGCASMGRTFACTDGIAKPCRTDFSRKYTWSKAPRYNNMAAEAGPFARVLMNANPDNLLPHQIYDPLFGNVYGKMGPNVFTRTLARVHEAARIYENINKWLSEIDLNGDFYIRPEERDGKGFGAIEAARGALARWIEIENGVIKNYQVILVTAKSKTFFEKLHKTKWMVLKDKNLQGDKTLYVREILIDNDPDEEDRPLNFEIKTTGIVTIGL